MCNRLRRLRDRLEGHAETLFVIVVFRQVAERDDADQAMPSIEYR